MSRLAGPTSVDSVRRPEVADPSDEGLVAARTRPTDLAHDRAAQRAGDGDGLRVGRAGDAPPAVAGVTSAQFDGRPGRWTAATRQIVAASVAGLAAAVAGVVGAGTGAAGAPAAVLCGAVLVSLAQGARLGRAGHRYAGLVLTTIPVGLALPIACAVARLGRLSLLDAGRVGLLVAWVALGVGIGLGRRERGALAGAVVGITLTGLPLLLGLAVPAYEVDALVAAVAGVACGLLPWCAMAASGLTGRDDAVLDAAAARTRTRVTLDEAYRGLTWSTLAVALTLTLSTCGLLTTGPGSATALGLVVVAIVALRTRNLPLWRQVVAMWGAVAVPLAVVLLGRLGTAEPALAVTVAVGAGVVMAVAAGLDLSGPRRVRLRRVGDLVERGCVLAVLLLTLAVFGVFIDVFGRF